MTPVQPRILVVDDDPANRRLLAALAIAEGCAVLEASGGAEALEIIARERIEVVLLDIMMPDVDGLAVLAELGRRGVIPSLPVVVVTAFDDRKVRIDALKAGAIDFVIKPVDAIEVACKLKTLIELRRLRQAAETDAEQARSQLRALLDNVPDVVVAVDRDGVIQYMNHPLPADPDEEAAGSAWLSRYPPAERAVAASAFEQVLATGASRTYDVRIAGVGGASRWFACHMGPVRRGEAIVGAVVISRDVTEKKRAEAQLIASERLAALGTLAAGVAHEINTPAQFVNDSLHFLRDATRDVFVFADTLREIRRLIEADAPAAELQEAGVAAGRAEDEADFTYLQENVPKAFERCLDGLTRISTIVRSMKEFAHPAPLDMEAVDLNRAIQNTLIIARNEYKYVAELETELDVLPPVTCFVDAINQVVLNLVVNAAHAIGDAVKGTEKRGHIKIRSRQDGADIVISISDTGGGIPEAISQRIFEPFFTTKEVGKGTGQGLALAWTVVKDKHGGALSYESRMGEGTTFFIRLPVAGKRSIQGLDRPRPA